jgi:hypothetical protein
MTRNCDKAKDDIAARRDKFKGSEPKPIDNNHVFYRLVSKRNFDSVNAIVDPKEFTQPGLSVFVAGSGFEAFDIETLLKEQAEKHPELEFIGAVKISAETVKEIGTFDFIHDPHPFDDKDGSICQQHPNHAQVICSKKLTEAERFAEKAVLCVKPSPDLD